MVPAANRNRFCSFQSFGAGSGSPPTPPGFAPRGRRAESRRPTRRGFPMRIRWRGLELPNKVHSERSSLADTYGKFYVEPFECGFGMTVGNSLRRILLSSLEGSAVTRIKIQGVQHEFTTIPGIVEDVTDICLNLKSVVVKNHGLVSKTLRIERHERGVVTAGDIVVDDQVEIVNKDLVIATMTDDVSLHVELLVENGRGYLPVSEQPDHQNE